MRCATCGSENNEHLWSNLKKESPRHKTQPLDVMICKDCGLVFLDLTGLAEETLFEYYSTSNTFEKPGPLPEGHKALREHQVNWAMENLPEGANPQSFLDVGCGAGYIANLYKQKSDDVFGTDLSHAMIANLKDLYGIEGKQGPFSADLVNRKFDFVSCITVLEHMYDPYYEILEMKKCINPDGFLFLEVPDAEFPRSDTIVDHLAFDHLWHWCIPTLARLMERCGFKILGTFTRLNPLNSGNPEQTLRIIGQLSSEPFEKEYQKNFYDYEKKALAKYKADHKEYLDAFQGKLDGIQAKIGDEPVAIFPGGEHTGTLLERFDFSKFNIVNIYDNDPAVTGKTFFGITIKHGSEAAEDDTGHYLLSTTNHEKSICEQLKTKKPDVKVYGLYNDLD